MADKSISELVAANLVTPTDLFVLEQSGTAKKLTGQVLENWLVSFADGHGGIQSIQKLSTSGLVDTYRITLADATTFDFVVTNGRSINSIEKTSTSGLVDNYTIEYNDGTTSTFTVKNGEKGDKGDNAYVWIKYASQEPTEESPSMGDIPDTWIGIYSGNASSAPTDWKQYRWFQIKGNNGDTGAPATLANKSVTYQVGDSGSIIPSGEWVSSVPVVPQGKYLWTKTELQFNTGDPIVSYVSARQGIDGSGSVSSVNNVSPDDSGNVPLTADNVGALPSTGGDITGEIRMNGQSISGLNAPTEDTQAANKWYVDSKLNTDLTADGAGAHNSIYRGKDLGSTVTDEQWAAIKDGTFKNLYIGDCWTIGDVTYRIAAFDYYYMAGDTQCTHHHVTLVPDASMYAQPMNPSPAHTNGAYIGSEMYKTGLNQAKSIINTAFGADHVLNHRAFLSNAVTDGYVSGGSWYNSTVELMNEQNVYGCIILGNIVSGTNMPFNYSLDSTQYPLFRFRPDLISDGGWYWLRDVTKSDSFAYVHKRGSSQTANSNTNAGVRPAFSIYSA